MSKQYTFFRTHDGKADRSPDGKCAPVYLLAEIGKSARLTETRAVSWPGATFIRYEVPIRLRVGIMTPEGAELNDTDTWRIVWSAIKELSRKAPGKPILPSDLLKEADGGAAAFFRKPSTTYVMVSSLSIKSFPAQRIRLGNCIISPLKERGTRYPIPSFATIALPNLSDQSSLVRVSTSGRSIYEAATSALDSLNLLRSIWSLFFTYRSWKLTFGGNSRRPLGIIHTGMVHTLHFPDGRPLDEKVYWAEPDTFSDRPIFEPEEWAPVEQNRRWALRCLSHVQYSADLKDLLLRYVFALDQKDPHIAFLNMWSILEKITDTVGVSYDQTINRALWVYRADSRSMEKDVLESLRLYRNRYVHSGVGDPQPDQIAYQIKSFVDPHLIRLLRNPFRASTLAEYASSLTLPMDVDALRRKRELFTKAIKLLDRR